MNPNLTEVIFILDRSGSMRGLEADTIGGFNSLLERQKKEEGEALLSTLLFDDECQVLHDRMDIRQVPPLTEKDYYVRGCTALLDAVGGAIHHIENVHRYIRPEDVPARTLFVITTDGMENASHKFSLSKVKQMIRRRQAECSWEFLFLGANIDAIATAERMGIPRNRAADYMNDREGTLLHYEAVDGAVSRLRKNRPLGADWKEKLDADYSARKGKKLPTD